MRRRRPETILKSLALALTLLFVAAACSVLPPGLFAVEPAVTASPQPPTVCERGADLRLAIEDLGAVELSETGVLGLLITVEIAVNEARQFGTAVGDEFGPLVADLQTSLQGLQTTLEGMGDEPTLGAKVASVGESITQIGNAMDALAVQLRTPCPSEAPA